MFHMKHFPAPVVDSAGAVVYGEPVRSSDPTVYHRRAWQRVRLAALRRDEHRCQRCGRLSGILEVHHLKPVRNGGAPYDLANLETLCRECHLRLHDKRPLPGRQEWRDHVRRNAQWKHGSQPHRPQSKDSTNAAAAASSSTPSSGLWPLT